MQTELSKSQQEKNTSIYRDPNLLKWKERQKWAVKIDRRCKIKHAGWDDDHFPEQKHTFVQNMKSDSVILLK